MDYNKLVSKELSDSNGSILPGSAGSDPSSFVICFQSASSLALIIP